MVNRQNQQKYSAVDPELEKKTILLLDDEPDITSVLSVALKSSGFAVDVFNDPQSALSHFKNSIEMATGQEKYDMVISDIRMPGMSGFEFAGQVNALDKEVKIVLITAFEVKRQEFENVLPALRIDALLYKPLRMTRLNDLVRSLLSSDSGIAADHVTRDNRVYRPE